jgi:hypothetical protein
MEAGLRRRQEDHGPCRDRYRRSVGWPRGSSRRHPGSRRRWAGHAAVHNLFPSWRHLFADSAYAGDELLKKLAESGHCTIELVKRPAATIGIQPLPRRWVVERTVALLNRNRRSAKDFEASAPVPPPGFTLLLCDSPSGGSHKYNLYDAGSDIIAVHVQRLKSEYASRTVDLEQDGYFSITHLLKRRDSALAHRAERHIDERGTKGTRWKRYRYSV